MFESDKRSPLDRANKSLYSRRSTDAEPPRHSIHAKDSEVPESWDGNESKQDENGVVMPVTPQRRYGYKMVFIFSAFFFVVAAAIAAYTFFGGGNYVSVENVDILIEGPSSVAGGDPLNLNVSVVNKNSTDIQLVDLVAEYPQGTKDATDPTKDLSRSRISLGDIKSQSLAQKTLSSILFGEEGAARDIKFTAEYRTADSNAVFFKEKVYHVTISSSPVSVSIDTLDKVLGGQGFDVTITVNSNTTTTVKDVLLSLDYPFGFSIVSSNPDATYGDNIWRIGDLAPGSKRTITLHATASGQDGEERTLHAMVGIQSQTNEREIATTIMTSDHTFAIERPFLALDLALNGTHDDVSVATGETVHADVIWTNNSPSKITNAKIVAQLGGNVLDKNSVIVDGGGYYDSLANTITWQAGRTNGLDTIAPGDDGRVGFSFSSPRSLSGLSGNPQVTIAVSASGDRIDESGTPQSITAGVSHSVKLVSNLALSSRILHTQGPIQNSGPIPPKVDQATTYTVIWTVTNTSNAVTGAKVTATLPPYVSWTGTTVPADANISYNPTGGIITWVAGEIPAHADIGSGAKQVAFQISFKPSSNQSGAIPDLVSAATIIGTDVFAGTNLQNSAPPLSTRTSTDLLYKPGDETVSQ